LFKWITRKMMKDPYTEDAFPFFAVIPKLSPRALIEAGMRAETGKAIYRPLGSPFVLSDWHKILFNPVHMFKLPTEDGVKIQTGTTIGPRAKKPLHLEIPIIISGMSCTGALSLKAKIALARGASMAGTATNSGEAPLIDEERKEAKFFIGQYNRGGWMNSAASLRQLDAIEIQLGQGALAAAPMSIPSTKIDKGLRRAKKLRPGEDAVIHTRLPGVHNQEDLLQTIQALKKNYDVPVGVKICATHYIEQELDAAIQAGVDYFVVDGTEAGTHGGSPTLQDDVGLPTLFALNRAVKHLEQRGVKEDISIIASGGLTTPGHFLKAMALGADAVYIGSIALAAMSPQTQVNLGNFRDDINVVEYAERLANFLTSCVEEMKLVMYSMGKTDFTHISRSDLVTVNRDLADVLGIDYAGFAPNQQRNQLEDDWIPTDIEAEDKPLMRGVSTKNRPAGRQQ
jgi:glutamate synthase domain-containing protein 2